MHRFLPLRQLTESELIGLISQLDDLKTRELTSICSASEYAVTITFQPSADDLRYQIKSRDSNVRLANVQVEVHNKRNGGKPKVRIATNDALITVTSSDEATYYFRIVRCACCLSEAGICGAVLFCGFILSRSFVALRQTLHPPLSENENLELKAIVVRDGVHMDYFRRFFDTLEGLTKNESTVKLWLLRANFFDDGQRIYIDQLKALVQDMSMMLDKVIHSRLMNGRDDDIRALAWRMGLLDAAFAYRGLVHRNGGGVAEFQDVAKFGYLFAAHIEELLEELSVAKGRPLEEPIALLVNAVSVRKWVGKRWTRVDEKPALPMFLEIVVDEMVC